MNLKPPPPSPPLPSNSNPLPLSHPLTLHWVPPPPYPSALSKPTRPFRLHATAANSLANPSADLSLFTMFWRERGRENKEPNGGGPPSASSFGYERKAVGESKSLVDDEAELSDWFSELRTDPNRHGGGRGVESDENPRGRVRDRGRDRDREAYPAKRSRRDSGGGGGEFGESRTQGGFRSSRSNSSSLSKRGGRGGRAVDSGF